MSKPINTKYFTGKKKQLNIHINNIQHAPNPPPVFHSIARIYQPLIGVE